ncbi:MAG: hypothetical protein HYR72_07485 [Deltaproteobacteria bacterium]|nr:hypothetical protein [Deltaproteobacteria bacterium]MBI3386931.1 hypothetical protein [Deltaproteobacteria bacterium]
MQFSHLPTSKPAPKRVKTGPVFCVGWRAFVNWPQPNGGTPLPVPMTDAEGKTIGNDLIDGQEVEIVSWRPRAREGVAYQIRRITDRSEWWVAALYLRRLRLSEPRVATPI